MTPQPPREIADDRLPTILPYRKARRRYQRSPALSFKVMASLTAGHLLTEFVIWNVYFYGLGRHHATTSNLLDLEQFQFSYAAEIVVAVFSGLCGAGIICAYKMPAIRIRQGWLHVCAFALGGLITAVPWIARLGDLFSVVLVLLFTLASAMFLAEWAKRRTESAAFLADD